MEPTETAPDTENTETAETAETPLPPRLKILLRLLFTILFLLVFEIVKLIVQVVVLVQYVILFITRKPNESLRSFGNTVSAYSYRLLRYVTLCENQRPYPLSPFPEEPESPEEEVRFE